MSDHKTAMLQAFLDAFNARDVDAIMSFFTEDCVFDTPRGPAPGGQHLVGKRQVRAGIQARFDGIPDIHYGDDRHWTCGDRGVSEWTIRGTQVTGETIEVRGCDLFELTDNRISRQGRLLEDRRLKSGRATHAIAHARCTSAVRPSGWA